MLLIWFCQLEQYTFFISIMKTTVSRNILWQIVWHWFALMSLTLPNYVYAEIQLLATPKDTTVNVGTTMNLTCIIAETYEEILDHSLHWIISWDATASVQYIPVNLTQTVTGFHYGQEAERGEYSIEYEQKQLNTPNTDCTHVIHISVLHIRNTTLRDAGTFACADAY